MQGRRAVRQRGSPLAMSVVVPGQSASYIPCEPGTVGLFALRLTIV